MWYISIFDAKEDTTLKDIEKNREDWIKQGKDQLLANKCRSIDRYEIIGMNPLKVIFVIEADNPGVLNLLSRCFGDNWHAVSYPVAKRSIHEALEEDHSIVCG
ncbi:MAG: hypothetical protein AB1632_04050 [Nitrospirota bacterium]